MNIVVTAASQIEAVLKRELELNGFAFSPFLNGRTIIEGGHLEIARANVLLRTAERVYLELARFKATTFDELFDGVYSVNYRDSIAKTAKIHVSAKCAKSVLMAFSACQSVANKAICEKLHFASLDFQSIDGIIKAIGLPRCKLCTYCWNGKE